MTGSCRAVATIALGLLVPLASTGCEQRSQPAPPARSGSAATAESATHSAREPAASSAEPAPPPAPQGEKAPPEAGSFIGTRLAPDAVVEELGRSSVRSFKPVGTASVVFQMRLRGPVDATFEPATKRLPDRHRTEVAAYRLGRLLRLDNVPPARMRRIERRLLRERLHPDYRDVWDDVLRWTAWDDDGTVSGAAVFWSPTLRNLPLAEPRHMKRWLGWLRQDGSVPDGEQQLAADLSTVVAFDYLIGHTRRFRTGSLQGPPSGRRLYIRNNEPAFPETLRPYDHRELMDRLQKVQRFSRPFVSQLLELDEQRLGRALRERDAAGATGAPLLNEARIAGVLERRRALLSYLGALVHEHGRQRVLSLP